MDLLLLLLMVTLVEEEEWWILSMLGPGKGLLVLYLRRLKFKKKADWLAGLVAV